MASNPECQVNETFIAKELKNQFLCLQEQAFEELHSVFGDSDRLCTRQDMVELKYLECCIKETLRMYPSVPAVLRSITELIQIGSTFPNSKRIFHSTVAFR